MNNEQPGKNTAHHGDAKLLIIAVDLTAQPVTGKRQGNEADNGHKVTDISHPVVACPIGRVLGRGQEPEARVRRHHRAAKGDIGDKAVQVHRHPGEVVHRLPGGTAEHPRVQVDTHRRGHKGGPRVRDHHQDQTEVIEQDTKADVHPLLTMQKVAPPRQ